MTHSLWALLAFAGWTLVLAIAVVIWRLPLIVFKGYGVHKFPSGSQHGPDRYWRLNRAHANALENLLPFAVIVLVGRFSGFALPLAQIMAPVVFCARMAQSLIHVAANTAASVTLRFVAFLTQWLCMGAMLVELSMAAR